jgi:hypothetical protein
MTETLYAIAAIGLINMTMLGVVLNFLFRIGNDRENLTKAATHIACGLADHVDQLKQYNKKMNDTKQASIDSRQIATRSLNASLGILKKLNEEDQ